MTQFYRISLSLLHPTLPYTKVACFRDNRRRRSRSSSPRRRRQSRYGHCIKTTKRGRRCFDRIFVSFQMSFRSFSTKLGLVFSFKGVAVEGLVDGGRERAAETPAGAGSVGGQRGRAVPPREEEEEGEDGRGSGGVAGGGRGRGRDHRPPSAPRNPGGKTTATRTLPAARMRPLRAATEPRSKCSDTFTTAWVTQKRGRGFPLHILERNWLHILTVNHGVDCRSLNTYSAPGTAQNIATGGDRVVRVAREAKKKKTTGMALLRRWSSRKRRQVVF